MINLIGQDLGLLMNDVALLKVNGQIRFLSSFFLKTSYLLKMIFERIMYHAVPYSVVISYFQAAR